MSVYGCIKVAMISRRAMSENLSSRSGLVKYTAARFANSRYSASFVPSEEVQISEVQNSEGHNSDGDSAGMNCGYHRAVLC